MVALADIGHPSYIEGFLSRPSFDCFVSFYLTSFFFVPFNLPLFSHCQDPIDIIISFEVAIVLVGPLRRQKIATYPKEEK